MRIIINTLGYLVAVGLYMGISFALGLNNDTAFLAGLIICTGTYLTTKISE